MTRALSLQRLFARITVGIVSVVFVGALSYGLLLPLVLGQTNFSPHAIVVGLGIGLAVSLGLLAQCLLLLPRLRRLVDAAIVHEPPDPLDRDEVYALPRVATFRVGVAGLCTLAIGYLPVGGAIVQERTLAANVGAVCAALTAGVLYTSLRAAMRPLLEALRDDGRWDWDLDEVPVSTGDRLALRVALAVAIPASAAALLATLLVGAHLTNVAVDQRASARESFNQALSVPLRPGESAAGLEVAASALRGADMPVTSTDGVYQVPVIAATSPTPPFWSIPIALLVGLIAGPLFGRRIGERASLDLESAARRMITVGASDIRTVTMGMARPQSVPEIREMALALDTLAATLLRMAEDQKRALASRTEAARVRSFVLASVSHDLRGPLNSVLGFADLLLSGVEGPLLTSQRESLEALSRGGRDLLRLVEDLLDHARLDAGRMTIERSRITMDSVVERARTAAIERAKVPVATSDIVIEGEARLQIAGDEERMVHALGALVAFALLRPGSDRRVTVRIHREGENCALSIRSGGTTPARDALARMFEPFDFAPSGARAPAGLNLAVSVARGLLRLHGGTVQAEPDEEGGISIQITLPLAS